MFKITVELLYNSNSILYKEYSKGLFYGKNGGYNTC